ncbi:unnamed protein product [Protopolystoma xenopodis]|uniref:Uncharacterized protein n=1 Tax=Protopolystoma xenopodis TaxID=117903 RepID=A0A3S5C6Z8_9PLAT|nr:unnamed protein product [Protopolystoma xenopodis]
MFAERLTPGNSAPLIAATVEASVRKYRFTDLAAGTFYNVSVLAMTASESVGGGVREGAPLFMKVQTVPTGELCRLTQPVGVWDTLNSDLFCMNICK